MKYSLCLSLMCAAVLYGCVEDHAIVADPCEMDSDCPGTITIHFTGIGHDRMILDTSIQHSGTHQT